MYLNADWPSNSRGGALSRQAVSRSRRSRSRGMDVSYQLSAISYQVAVLQMVGMKASYGNGVNDGPAPKPTACSAGVIADS
jgi:hypothetical protein